MAFDFSKYTDTNFTDIYDQPFPNQDVILQTTNSSRNTPIATDPSPPPQASKITPPQKNQNQERPKIRPSSVAKEDISYEQDPVDETDSLRIKSILKRSNKKRSNADNNANKTLFLSNASIKNFFNYLLEALAIVLVVIAIRAINTPNYEIDVAFWLSIFIILTVAFFILDHTSHATADGFRKGTGFVMATAVLGGITLVK